MAAAAAIVCCAHSAHADSSSWLFVGTGPSWHSQGAGTESQLSLQLETGLGTPPDGSIIFGSLFRVQPHFGKGTDLGLTLRTATHGFVNGDWGAAVDLGGYQRWWGRESTGLLGSAVLGGPWGLTMSATATRGSNEGRSYSVVLGIDLLRLTVYRTTGDSWWKNPFPAHRPTE